MSLEELFGTAFKLDELSEEAQGQIVAVFEAKVKEGVLSRMDEERAVIQKEFDDKFTIEVNKLEESVDSYLTRASEKWIEDNKISITESTQVTLANSLFSELKDLLEKHNIQMPEGKEDLIELKQTEISEMTEKYNGSVEEIQEKNKEIEGLIESHNQFKRGLVLSTICEGMADSEADKVKTLTEEIEYVDAKDFKGKVEAVIASLDEKKEVDEEEDEDEDDKNKKDKGDTKDEEGDDDLKESKKVAINVSQTLF